MRRKSRGHPPSNGQHSSRSLRRPSGKTLPRGRSCSASSKERRPRPGQRWKRRGRRSTRAGERPPPSRASSSGRRRKPWRRRPPRRARCSGMASRGRPWGSSRPNSCKNLSTGPMLRTAVTMPTGCLGRGFGPPGRAAWAEQSLPCSSPGSAWSSKRRPASRPSARGMPSVASRGRPRRPPGLSPLLGPLRAEVRPPMLPLWPRGSRRRTLLRAGRRGRRRRWKLLTQARSRARSR
mmetsp:Transcript_27228/g.90536  ORF Transcript_27228/g.90536 Transcript_27228/m.90536 type:complete len:236 (+) Transcript_27228:525-1232(+)